MRAVKSRDTGPEMIVRRLAHRMGYRFRLYRPDLPGKADLTFPSRKAVIFVHGCFWHGHNCKRGARVPKANRAYSVGLKRHVNAGLSRLDDIQGEPMDPHHKQSANFPRARPLVECRRCGERLFMPESSELIDTLCVRHSLGCDSCGHAFETIICLAAAA